MVIAILKRRLRKWQYYSQSNSNWAGDDEFICSHCKLTSYLNKHILTYVSI